MAGEKRTQDQEDTLLSETVVLVDIEGTTTSISFVKETLFPYVRENLKKYIDGKWEDVEFKKDLEKLKEQAKKDEENKIDGFIAISGSNADEEKESLIKNVLWQMDADRKTGALKQLQGHMWREAYDSGAVKAHVYDDVPKALESWIKDGRKVYVYSSGSVEAQKLLFGHSVHGDLLKYFSGYFDTEVGAKQESNSYKNILSKIGVEPSSVIFLTDVVKEAEAAKEAGLSTALVVRDGNAALTDEERVAFTTVKSFLDLSFQSSAKRQKLDTKESVKKSVVEPMDTSEDVEMSDVSEKKAESKETVESEKDEKRKDGLKDEPMATDTKDIPSAEKVTDGATPEGKTSEVSKELDASKDVDVATDNTESKLKPVENDKDKVSEKVEKTVEKAEKAAEPAPAEPTPAANDPPNVETCESKSKSEQVSATEKKTHESTDVPKETKSDVSDAKTAEDGLQGKNNGESAEEKVEECAKSDKEPAKEQANDKPATNSSTAENQKAEKEETSAKPEQEPAKVEQAAVDVTENGNGSTTNVEKSAGPTITEPEATSSKVDTNTEAANESNENFTEAKPEKELESTDEKSSKAKDDKEEVTATEKVPEKQETTVDASKQQESTKESVKEETVVDEVKDKNTTVDSEKKKLNGTTQNGDTDVPVSEDKLHRNGLNEGSSNEKITEKSSAQNGEPESSSEGSAAESIKVKKVVDSTVADGAGESDVVPPVVVAATS